MADGARARLFAVRFVAALHGAMPRPPAFGPLVARRAAGEPLAHVTGETEFYGLRLQVTPDVLVPRSDTELLIDIAREKLADRPPERILDCGTGSGALLLAALSVWPMAKGVGIERSPAALCGRACQYGGAEWRQNRATMMAADWTRSGWMDGLGRFDLVLANPPYVATDDPDLAADVAASDPHGALFAGADGLDDYRILIPSLIGLLAPGGRAVFEIGIAPGRGGERHCPPGWAARRRARGSRSPPPRGVDVARIGGCRVKTLGTGGICR